MGQSGVFEKLPETGIARVAAGDGFFNAPAQVVI